MQAHYDIAVVGGGLAGTVAALAAAAEGWRVAFIAPQPPRQDGRTTALLSESLDLLSSLGVWDTVRPSSAPLRTMRILDGTSRLFRAPPVSFPLRNRPRCVRLQHPQPAAVRRASCRGRLRKQDRPFRSIFSPSPNTSTMTVCCSRRWNRAPPAAALAADGRNSTLRDAIGIKRKDLVLSTNRAGDEFQPPFRAWRCFDRISHRTGPVHASARCPASARAWSGPSSLIRWMTFSPSRSITERRGRTPRMRSILGAVEVENEPQAWPLSSLIADRFGAGRTMLVGETGPCLPAHRRSGPKSWSSRYHAGRRDSLRDAGGPAEQAPRAVGATIASAPGCNQPHCGRRSAQPGTAELVSADAGVARRRPRGPFIHSPAPASGDARRHDAGMAQEPGLNTGHPTK
jgi:2-octaprenyl-6-methoxyphenol hydroxylase